MQSRWCLPPAQQCSSVRLNTALLRGHPHEHGHPLAMPAILEELTTSTADPSFSRLVWLQPAPARAVYQGTLHWTSRPPSGLFTSLGAASASASASDGGGGLLGAAIGAAGGAAAELWGGGALRTGSVEACIGVGVSGWRCVLRWTRRPGAGRLPASDGVSMVSEMLLRGAPCGLGGPMWGS